MADTFGTPFFLPFQSFLKKPTLVSGYKIQPGGARQYFYTSGGSVGKKAFADPACEHPRAQGNHEGADARGLLPPVYLGPDGDDEYRAALAADIDAGRTESTLYSIDSVPRIQENFESDTVTVTYTGFSADPSGGMLLWYRFGRLCLLIVPGATGTSNGTGFTIGTLPAAIRPDTEQYGYFPYAVDNGSVVGATAKIGTDGVIDMSPSNAAYNEAGWTASGSKGLSSSVSRAPLFYRISDD